MVDVVYMVREGSRNEELRFSLRSVAANLPHSRVWIVGYRPPWVTGVRHLKVRQGTDKHANTWALTTAIANCPEISDEFVWMHDDLFVMAPVDRVPVMHRGTLDDWFDRHRATRGSWAVDKMRATQAALVDFGRPAAGLLSYELHVPLPVDRRWLAEAIAYADFRRERGLPGNLAKRTLYGNIAGVGGVLADDCKIANTDDVPDPGRTYLSTSDGSFKYWKVGRHIRGRFTAPSPYEQPMEIPRRLPRSRPLHAT